MVWIESKTNCSNISTYLVSKVFEDQVNRLSSGVYSVRGDLESPEVLFERVFDASSRADDAEN